MIFYAVREYGKMTKVKKIMVWKSQGKTQLYSLDETWSAYLTSHTLRGTQRRVEQSGDTMASHCVETLAEEGTQWYLLVERSPIAAEKQGR